MKIAIVGTGISALLLAQSLVRRNAGLCIRLFGPNLRQNPHVLSLWSDRSTPFDRHCIARWRELAVVNPDGTEHRLSLRRQLYRSFRAQTWADATFAELSERGDVKLVRERVTQVETHGTHATVVTPSRAFDADWVFSSVSSGAVPSQTQQFLGCELELTTNLVQRPPHFLDFRTEQANDFRFIYTLPLAERRLFIEHVSYRPCDHRAAIERYLSEVLGLAQWTLRDQEGGATPLFEVVPPRRNGRVVYIGVAAGLAKAATGYAIMRMWRDAEHLASTLARYGEPQIPAPSASLQSLADRYFFDVMKRQPTHLASMLSTLFRKAPGDAVLAFLDDQASLGEQLRVAVAMPHWLRWLLTKNSP